MHNKAIVSMYIALTNPMLSPCCAIISSPFKAHYVQLAYVKSGKMSHINETQISVHLSLTSVNFIENASLHYLHQAAVSLNQTLRAKLAYPLVYKYEFYITLFSYFVIPQLGRRSASSVLFY